MWILRHLLEGSGSIIGYSSYWALILFTTHNVWFFSKKRYSLQVLIVKKTYFPISGLQDKEIKLKLLIKVLTLFIQYSSWSRFVTVREEGFLGIFECWQSVGFDVYNRQGFWYLGTKHNNLRKRITIPYPYQIAIPGRSWKKGKRNEKNQNNRQFYVSQYRYILPWFLQTRVLEKRRKI